MKAQLISDVPLGAFLSGGVDSSLVAAHMGSAQAFSIGFDDPSYNELPWAQRVARHLGIALDFEIIAPRAIELFSSLMDAMDDPIGDFRSFPPTSSRAMQGSTLPWRSPVTAVTNCLVATRPSSPRAEPGCGSGYP